MPKNSLLLTTLLFAAHVAAFRFTLDSNSPALSLSFNVKGRQTFYAVSSGE